MATSAAEKRPRPGHPAGGLRFDRAAVALGGWLVGGALLDIWAHIHLANLETFFTPWHGVLYAGFLANFAFLLLTAARNRRRGYAWPRALPPGYPVSLLGAAVFLAGGALDLLWHQLFGIEVDTEALVSPTHLTLALGVVLIVSGPLRAAWQRPGAGTAPGWAALLPALLALTLCLALLAAFTLYAHPLVDPWAARDPAARAARAELFMVRPDGGGLTRLTLDPAGASREGAWSPDGRRIVFDVGDDSGRRELYIMDADGGNRRQLTATAARDRAPAWSPDGRTIAFQSTRAGDAQIYAIDAAGGEPRRLTAIPGEGLGPAWSPDGARLALTVRRAGRLGVALVQADGTGLVYLPTDRGDAFGPSWSPDGRRLAFTSQRDGHDEVYTMAADGGGQTRLTVGTAGNWGAAWSPDGRTLAFLSDRDGHAVVYVMAADGGGQADASRDPGADAVEQDPRWSPDGARLLYTARSRPVADPALTVGLGLAGILVQAALLTGAVLLAVRRWTPPVGGLALVVAGGSLPAGLLHGRYALLPAALLGGLAADLLGRLLRPAPARPLATRLFAFAVPAACYALYFATLAATVGLAWSVHLWAGATLLAGLAGALVGALVGPAPVAATRSTPAR